MSQQQQHPGQTLLAGVEELIDQIRFVSDVARKQMHDEQFREVVLFVQCARHQRLLNPGQSAISHGGSRGDAQQLACQASLAEEVTVAQNGDDRFLPC